MADLKLLKFPGCENRIQNRVDRFCEETFPQLTPEQVDQLLEHTYAYLLKIAEMEEESGDPTFAMNAIARIGDARFWIYQLSD